jgi:hypothetical protein
VTSRLHEASVGNGNGTPTFLLPPQAVLATMVMTMVMFQGALP